MSETYEMSETYFEMVNRMLDGSYARLGILLHEIAAPRVIGMELALLEERLIARYGPAIAEGKARIAAERFSERCGFCSSSEHGLRDRPLAAAAGLCVAHLVESKTIE